MRIINKLILSLLSGCIIGFSMRFNSLAFLLWFGFIPLFLSLQDTKPKLALLLGLTSGLGCSLFMLNWIISTVSIYMGGGIGGSFLAFTIIALLYSSRFVIFTFLFSWMQFSNNKDSILRMILVAAIWTSLEYLNAITTTTFPWFTFHLGYTLVFLPKFIQLAEFAGVFGISFSIVLVNYIFFLFFNTKKKSYLISGFGILLIQFIFGWLLMANVSDGEKNIKVSIIQENMPAQMRWEDTLTDSLVEYYYLAPLHEAANNNPNLILWSETAIPWKLFQDDNLVYEALNITWPSRAGHIIGMHSEVPNKPEKTYNSAFYIQPDGAITGRYDKMYPLTFLESPLYNGTKTGKWMLPFFTKSRLKIEPGKRINLLKTPYGKVGISICNESLLGFHTRNSVNQGANFLMVMSNDAWFANTDFPYYHFTHTIIRAVENRRDVAVNSNRGYATIVDASGRIMRKNISDNPTVLNGAIAKRTQNTFYTKYGDVFSVSCLGFVAIFMLYICFKTKKLKEISYEG